MNFRPPRITLLLFLVLGLSFGAAAQLTNITEGLEKEKPEKYKNRVLRSEKTGEKKFTKPRRFFQNTTSHYNYFFNAQQKLKSVIERARIAHKDDYSKLLPYYSYSTEETAAYKNELDSVILKSTAGILLHDLRSDWVDNFYLLIGKAYYLLQDFDSAYMSFQFINYKLFPPDKKHKDEQLIVGSNENKITTGLSISTKEDRNFIDRIFSRPPSRNDALVWQIRTLTDMDKYGEAAGIINTLRNDPYFPKRLETLLDENEGYWFYQRGMFDSALTYIEKALPNAPDLQNRARREYLLAQLYEKRDSQDTASYYYSKAIRHTTDPLLNIYANLNKAKMIDSDDPEDIMAAINHMKRMARKDNYKDYRDIIFFSAAELAGGIPDTALAMNLFLKSTRYNQDNISLKNKAFLTLANTSYDLRRYRDAFNYYDSLQTGDTSLGDMTSILNRKNALAKIVEQISWIEREDSLQAIAALPAYERDALLKKLSRKLRKERGVPEEDQMGIGFENSSTSYFENKNQTGGLFGQNSAKGEWYFYNQSLKSKGFNEFKRDWGKRENVDNWRRLTSNQSQVTANKRGRNQMPPSGMVTPGNSDPMAPSVGPNPDFVAPETIKDINFQQDISVEGLKANLPLTAELLDSSNNRKAQALFTLGMNYQKLLEDYRAAANTYEKSLKEYPDSLYNGELYLNLSYCYSKLGNEVMAGNYKNKVLRDFAQSKSADYLLHPQKYNTDKKDSAATQRYEAIYTKFIEGHFEEAVQEKLQADSIYGKNYWNPQLLYIEAVYFIKQREDSTAMKTLEQIVDNYHESPLSIKAIRVMKALSKRDSIEAYLTKLEVKRIPADSQIVAFDDARIYGNIGEKPVRDDSNLLPKNITTVDVPELNPEKKKPTAIVNRNFSFDPLEPQYVIMSLTKVDPVYSSEARRALERYNGEKHYRLNLKVAKDTLDSARTLLVINEFISAEAALKYMDRLEKDVKSEISWLPADKYSFYIISEPNLLLLKKNKKLESYLDLLREKYPDRF